MQTETCAKFSGIIHYIDKCTLIASHKNVVYTSHNNGETWQAIFKITLPLSKRIKGVLSLSSRLFRAMVHHVACVDKNTVVLIGYGSIFALDLKNKKILSITPVHGKRPLALCSAESRLYYGEYRGNSERLPVHIFGSNDGGLNWKPVFQFKNIRHIHGVFNDPYENKVWVTTGDNDEEAGIYVTDDHFRTVEKVAGGTQQLRAVTLLFTKSHVYFGSDTQLERNFIYCFDKETYKVQRLQEVESSVFWGCKVGDYLFFSTVVEPSKVNKCRDACIWGSKDGERWKCVARFRKDIWPMRLFQYGQIFFPAGENNTEYLWFTPFATEKHMTVQRINVKELF